jgi:hypothetical protein
MGLDKMPVSDEATECPKEKTSGHFQTIWINVPRVPWGQSIQTYVHLESFGESHNSWAKLQWAFWVS